MNDVISQSIHQLENVRDRACLSGSDFEAMSIALLKLKTAARWYVMFERFIAMRDKYLSVGSADSNWAIRTMYNPLLERFRQGERTEELFGAMQVAGEE